MTAIGKRGAKSSGPIGWCVPGWSTGGGGCGRSAAKLYQEVGIASSGKRKRVVSSITALLDYEVRLSPVLWRRQRETTAPEASWPLTQTCAHGSGGIATLQQRN